MLLAKIKKLGPGLLFASSAIGTSHLILSTRAGVHYGFSFLIIIILSLLLKYPFYEFAPRYSSITGKSILWAYRDQGKWPLILFMMIILVNMFTVTAAIAAVCSGLIGSVIGSATFSMNLMVFLLLLITVFILTIGGFRFLDKIIKVMSLILIIAVCFIFFALIAKSNIASTDIIPSKELLQGSGLVLMVSLLGWMPSGMEASVMHSIWVVKKQEMSETNITSKETLFDFNFGYLFTSIMALMFLSIGALSVYGTGQTLEGNSVEFSAQLLSIFSSILGSWSYWAFGITAFITIYGTLIVVLDAFARSLIECLDVLSKSKNSNNKGTINSEKNLKAVTVIIAVGSFLLFYYFASSMITMLEFATTLAFICAPFIAFLNLKCIMSPAVSKDLKLPLWLKILALIGLIFLIIFAIYYIVTIAL